MKITLSKDKFSDLLDDGMAKVKNKNISVNKKSVKESGDKFSDLLDLGDFVSESKKDKNKKSVSKKNDFVDLLGLNDTTNRKSSSQQQSKKSVKKNNDFVDLLGMNDSEDTRNKKQGDNLNDLFFATDEDSVSSGYHSSFHADDTGNEYDILARCLHMYIFQLSLMCF